MYSKNQSVEKVSLIKKLASKSNTLLIKKNLTRFGQFLTLKNDFVNQNLDIFEEVVHNFGKSDNDMIK